MNEITEKMIFLGMEEKDNNYTVAFFRWGGTFTACVWVDKQDESKLSGIPENTEVNITYHFVGNRMIFSDVKQIKQK